MAAWVKATFGVSYTASGRTTLLHRLGYVYRKPRLGLARPTPRPSAPSGVALIAGGKFPDHR